jgi:hypothetical protein
MTNLAVKPVMGDESGAFRKKNLKILLKACDFQQFERSLTNEG